MAKVGRPSTYTQELADEMCEQLAMGYSIRTVCKPEGMPAISTFFKWIREHEDFSKQYAEAKQEAADAMAEEILEISNNTIEGETVTTKSDGTVETKKGDMLGHRRLQIDTRKFLMAKMKPKRYGEHLKIEEESTVTHKYEELTDEQLDDEIKKRKNRDT